MKALQVIQPGSFSVVQVPKPILDNDARDRILVRTSWVSMCGSDIPFFNGGKPSLPYPLHWGEHIHECVGMVVSSTSQNFQAGDWVVAIPEADRGLAELFIAQANKAVRIVENGEDKSDFCLIQPLSTVMNAVDRLGDIAGSTVAVIGLGSIGILFCWLLRKQGAGQIIGIDPLASRCDVADNFGADQTFPIKSDEYVRNARDSTRIIPIGVCIESVGHQMQTINDCFAIIQKHGTVLAFGVPDQPVYPIEYETFFRKNARLIAAVTPVWKEYLEKAQDLFLEHRDELTPLITHRFTVQDAEKAFKMYADHSDGICKAIIDFSHW